MLGEKRQYLDSRRFIIASVVLTAGWIINANIDNTATQVIVNLGEILILDCDLSGKNVAYPVRWITGSEYIGVADPKSMYPGSSFIHNTSLHPRHSVIYGHHSGSGLFTLKISTVQSSDAGEYECIDSTFPMPCQLQAFDVNVVTCQCITPDGIEYLSRDERITVSCIIQGYQSQHDGKTAVSITLGHDTIEGHLQGNVLESDVEVRNFCQDVFLQVNYIKKIHFSSPIQCQIPRLDPCPFIKSTPNVRPPPTTTAVQVSTLQTKEKRNSYTSSFFTETARMQNHTLSPSSTIQANKSTQYNTSPSFTIAKTMSIMFTSTTSPTKNIILISTTFAIAIAVTIGIVIIICVFRRRNERNNKSLGRKPETREQGERPGLLQGAERCQSVETRDLKNITFKETCRKKAPTVQAHYENVQGSNGAGNQEDSNIGLILNTVYEPSLIASTTMQPSASTQIKQDAMDVGPSISRPNTLQGTRESSTPCTQYEYIDFSEGTGADNRIAQPVISYQELVRDQITPFGQYKSLDLPGSTEESDDRMSSRQQQVVQETSNSCIEYASLEIPSAIGEGEKGDAPLYAVLEEEPPSENAEMEDPSNRDIDESGIHIYALPD